MISTEAYNVFVTLVLLCISASLYGYTRLKAPWMWVEALKVAALCCALGAGARVWMVLDASAVGAHLLWAAACLAAVTYVVFRHTWRHLPNIAQRKTLPAVLRSMYYVGPASFAGAAIAYGFIPVGANVEVAGGMAPAAYRTMVATPIAAYSAIASVLYAEAYLRYPGFPVRVRHRYLMFAAGTLSFVLLTAGWFAAPFFGVGATHTVLTVAWAGMATVWLGAMLPRYAPGDIEHAHSAYDSYIHHSDTLHLAATVPGTTPTTMEFVAEKTCRYCRFSPQDTAHVVLCCQLLMLILGAHPLHSASRHEAVSRLREARHVLGRYLPALDNNLCMAEAADDLEVVLDFHSLESLPQEPPARMQIILLVGARFLLDQVRMKRLTASKAIDPVILDRFEKACFLSDMD